jgi:hypothetical protein
MLVAMFAEHRVDELPIAVDCPVQVAPATGDLHVRLVEVPGDADTAAPLRAQLLAQQSREPELPFADGFEACCDNLVHVAKVALEEIHTCRDEVVPSLVELEVAVPHLSPAVW